MVKYARLLLWLFWLAWVPATQAQCVNSIEPSCSVYSSCFEKHCNCSGSDDEYLISFGKNYCEAFLSNHEFSDAGKKWRDSTLRCLQETLVPIIPLEAGKSCDCASVKRFAYSSHVACYTQPTASACDLPVADIQLIAKTIIFDKTFVTLMKEYNEGYKQVKGVLETCSTTAKEVQTRQKWAFYLKLIKGKVK